MPSPFKLPRDMDNFLRGYPNQSPLDPDDLPPDKNLRFYQNEIECQPDDITIDEIHQKWFGNYELLEWNHGYIQWLFPIREHGMNHYSQPLNTYEIEVMQADSEVMARVVKSYRLILDFFGMVLEDEETGLLGRTAAYKRNYHNLCYSPHNYLRITRILKCVSELGLEHLSAGFLLHILSEQSENRQLLTRSLINSMDRFWINCLRSTQEREWIDKLLLSVRRAGTKFTRSDYQRILETRAITKKLQWCSPTQGDADKRNNTPMEGEVGDDIPIDENGLTEPMEEAPPDDWEQVLSGGADDNVKPASGGSNSPKSPRSARGGSLPGTQVNSSMQSDWDELAGSSSSEDGEYPEYDPWLDEDYLAYDIQDDPNLPPLPDYPPNFHGFDHLPALAQLPKVDKDCLHGDEPEKEANKEDEQMEEESSVVQSCSGELGKAGILAEAPEMTNDRQDIAKVDTHSTTTLEKLDDADVP